MKEWWQLGQNGIIGYLIKAVQLVQVVDLSRQEFLNELGLEEHLNNYNAEIRKLCALLVEKDDPLLVERIKRIEEKRDKCFKLLRTLQREISPEDLITSVNTGYH